MHWKNTGMVERTWTLTSTLMPYNLIAVFISPIFFFYISKMVTVIVSYWFHGGLLIIGHVKALCLLHVSTYCYPFVKAKNPVFPLLIFLT